MEEEVKVILGLDVSTKTVGVTLALLDKEGGLKILQVTHLRPKIPTAIKGTEALFKKSKIVSDELSKYKAYNVTDVIIEEPLVGSNNSETVATLLRYNGMISQLIHYIFGVIPVFISSYDARKFAFPRIMAIRKFNKKGEVYDISKIRKCIEESKLVPFGEYPYDCAKKLILWNFVSEKYPEIEWQYKKNGDLKDENFDASDSLVCVLGYVNKCKYENDTPVVKNVTEKAIGDGSETEFTYTVEFCGETYEKRILI